MEPRPKRKAATSSDGRTRKKYRPDPSTQSLDLLDDLPEGDFWAKEILQEEKRDGDQVYYLVDFLPNEKTGEVYEPEWIPEADVGRALVKAWKRKNRKYKTGSPASKPKQASDTPQHHHHPASIRREIPDSPSVLPVPLRQVQDAQFEDSGPTPELTPAAESAESARSASTPPFEQDSEFRPGPDDPVQVSQDIFFDPDDVVPFSTNDPESTPYHLESLSQRSTGSGKSTSNSGSQGGLTQRGDSLQVLDTDSLNSHKLSTPSASKDRLNPFRRIPQPPRDALGQSTIPETTSESQKSLTPLSKPWERTSSSGLRRGSIISGVHVPVSQHATAEASVTHKRGHTAKSVAGHPPNSLYSHTDPSTSEKDFATGIVPSIEREQFSETPAVAYNTAPSQISVDQADISTEGEYSGPRDLRTPSLQRTEVPRSAEATIETQSPLRTPLRAGEHPVSSLLAAPNTDSSPAALVTASEKLHRAMEGVQPGSSLQPPTTTPNQQSPAASALNEDIRLLRSRSAIRAIAGQSLHDSPGTRSPSAIPDKMPETSRLEKPSSLSRVTGIDPSPTKEPIPEIQHEQQQDNMIKADVSSESESEPSDESVEPEPFPNIGTGEYAITLPMAEAIIDQYLEHIRRNAAFLDDFCSNRWDGDLLAKDKAASIVRYLTDVCAHVDLVTGVSMTQEMNQQEIPYERLVDWDIRNSKFAFLGRLVDLMRTEPYHLVIVCRPGPLVHLLERFLTNKKVEWRHVDASSELSERPESFLVSIVHHGTSDNASARLPKSDLIIDFDNCLYPQEPYPPVERPKSNSSVAQTIGQEHLPRKQTPVIHLLIQHSVEHVDRCLPRSFSGAERTQYLLTRTLNLRRTLGRYLYQKPVEIANEVASFVMATNEAETVEWPLEQPEIISDFRLIFADHDTSSADEQTGTSSASNPNKRSLVSILSMYDSVVLT